MAKKFACGADPRLRQFRGTQTLLEPFEFCAKLLQFGTGKSAAFRKHIALFLTCVLLDALFQPFELVCDSLILEGLLGVILRIRGRSGKLTRREGNARQSRYRGSPYSPDAAAVSDIISIWGKPAFWPMMSVWLVAFGVVGALFAALFGFIDYFTATMTAAIKRTVISRTFTNR